VRYPILPRVTRMESACGREMLRFRHHSLYAPRDFDISPYFAVVKPTIRERLPIQAAALGRPAAAAGSRRLPRRAVDAAARAAARQAPNAPASGAMA